MIRRKIIYTISHSCCDMREEGTGHVSDLWVVTREDVKTYKNKPRDTLARWFDRRYSANIEGVSEYAMKIGKSDCEDKGGTPGNIKLCPEGVSIRIEFEQYKNGKRTKYDRYPTILMRNEDDEDE